MNIIRVQKTRDYTVLSNHHLKNRSLSLKAKGLLSVLLSLPDDWRPNIEKLAETSADGKAAVRTALEELISAGYVLRERCHDDRGQFSGYDYLVRENPACAPLSENRTTVHPLSDFPTTDNRTTVLYNPNTNTPIAPTGGRRKNERKTEPDWKPERFEKFWRAYPVRKSKQAAIRAWDRLQAPDELLDAMAEALRRQLLRESWQRGFGIPYASTWLNQRRWEDEEGGRAAEAEPEDGGEELSAW